MALIQDHTQSSLERELKRVDDTPRGVENAVDQAREIVAGLMDELKMSEKDAKLALLANVKHSAEEDGTTLEDVYAKYPAALREYIQYTPEDLTRNQMVTVAGTVVSAVLFIASFAFAVGAVLRARVIVTQAMPAILKMLRNPRQAMQLANLLQVVKIAIGRKVALFGVSMAATSALGWLASTAVGNWNDVFHWGPQSAEQQADAVRKALRQEEYESGKGSGGFLRGINDELVPTKTTTKTGRHKMYLGTVLSGRVATAPVYVRGTDDQITSDEELETDANNELVNWIATLPSRMNWEIQIKDQPFDEYNVKRPGIWLTLSLYTSGKGGVRVFVDEILLGPIDPKVYVPDYSITESVKVKLDTLTMPDKLTGVETGDGGVSVITREGTTVEILPKASQNAAASSKTTAQDAPGATSGGTSGSSTTAKQRTSGVTLTDEEKKLLSPATGLGAVETYPGMKLGDFVDELGVRLYQTVLVDTPSSTLALRKQPGLDGELIVRMPHASQIAAASKDVRKVDGHTWAYVIYDPPGKEAYSGWTAWEYVAAT